ncbi:MAG: UDP-N-acetylglucosamine--N-acetylmuramyl-(pentapeptide) pyrophosphoryl-undecaprenol N-acetylglucosamine transferase 2 [Candidatus Parcubacteria bacterium]|nr:MAG: UDP-N-acetylglucosamine--N-acetylmuramyl-(pentapeptide) pyrophosphoryl-undecaprenol N-acetylglucosamine transferase 2 [Candidatus Parcubacteria bacterium]
MNNEEIRICLTGGATGGHFFPLVFVAREIKKIATKENLNVKIFYLGTKPFKEEILKKEGVNIYLLPEVKLRKYFSLKNVLDLIKFPFSFFIAFYYLFKFMPDLIFSKGGPSSLSVVLAGWILAIPIFIHESDSIPGLTNKISAKFATKIFLAFAEAEKYFPRKKTIIVGQPIDIEALTEKIIFEDYQRFGLDPHKKIVLVLGGSQGSRFLNDLIIEALPQLLNLAQVVHQTGEKKYPDAYLYAKGTLLEKNPERIKDYHPFPFIDHNDLTILMKISDLIIARAGSSTIFEIAALGKPSILIPIEEKVAGWHQVINARIYDHYGACKVLEEKNAKPHLLVSLIEDILKNEELMKSMSESALKFAKTDAGQKIAEEIVYFIK